MLTLEVDLGERRYPIHVGADLLGRPDLLAGVLGGPQVLVVTNDTVGPLYLDRLRPALGNRKVEVMSIPDGEAHKTFDTWYGLLDRLVERRFSRDCTVVALGGGVVGDIAGFAAASYQRGVTFVQIPTTLLAQVDSSVGGKTAINHPLGKNLIGAFHQPACVIADIATLDTLGERELAAGFAEVVKYGAVCDRDFFDWLEANADAILARDRDALARTVHWSCAIKARVVAADEREAGERALLNFGHTFGHAIEAGLGFGTWLHGEAVAAGMCIAADLCVRTGLASAEEAQRLRALLARARLPTSAPARLGPERMRELMALDKKVRAGRIRLVLMRGLGSGLVSDDYDQGALDATLHECRDAA
ncbi:MAG: 3-dehydroquinate synthase [Ectothiorhodospiraceae bacterium]|nr:3-dehydroquinate synthase [Chromatiales bacterium]MCP5156474.1 3-dehydroquinate synthase [Ectothiorhodospiraceae bacterium]